MKDDRPQLNDQIEFARKGDILVVYKLDRLGRSTKRIIELSEQFEKRGVELVSIRDNIDTTSVVGKAMFRMLAVLEEMERDLGLESARARERKGGRPKINNKKVEKALKLFNNQEYSVKILKK